MRINPREILRGLIRIINSWANQPCLLQIYLLKPYQFVWSLLIQFGILSNILIRKLSSVASCELKVAVEKFTLKI